MIDREKVIKGLSEVVCDMQAEVDEWKDYSDSELAHGTTVDCDWWFNALGRCKDALELLKAQEPHSCTDCIHYDKEHAVNGYAKCRNSLSPLYCSMLSGTNGCDYMERR